MAAADQRHRLSWWAARGLLPEGLPPSTIAAAYLRATGHQPARALERKASRVYSAWELLQARALQTLQLPSTRMLFSQQAHLEALQPTRLGDLVAVAPYWLPMVRTRADLLSDVLVAAVGRPGWLVLEAGR